jgi:hypothetical protein
VPEELEALKQRTGLPVALGFIPMEMPYVGPDDRSPCTCKALVGFVMPHPTALFRIVSGVPVFWVNDHPGVGDATYESLPVFVDVESCPLYVKSM